MFPVVAAFAWALYAERSAPYNLRLGPLPVIAWTTLIGLLILLPNALLFDAPREFARLDRPAGLLALHRDFPGRGGLPRLTAGLKRLGVSRVVVYMY